MWADYQADAFQPRHDLVYDMRAKFHDRVAPGNARNIMRSLKIDSSERESRRANTSRFFPRPRSLLAIEALRLRTTGVFRSEVSAGLFTQAIKARMSA